MEGAVFIFKNVLRYKFMDLPSLHQIVKDHGLLKNQGHSKRLGQNFLLDMGITRRIARLIPLDRVVEIGPGPGGLTRALLEEGSHVTAIEKDPMCIEALSSLRDYAKDRLNCIEADALSVNVFELYNKPFRIVANLPYNIGTELLVQWIQGLKRYTHLKSITVMLQKEVVDRIVAPVNTSEYGRLSILCQYACDVRKNFLVKPECFTPPPKVTSAVVTLIPKRDNYDKITILENLTRIAFGQRRKMLRNTLGRQYPECDFFQKEVRPETIAVSEWEMIVGVF